jgi:hypothetical protein
MGDENQKKGFWDIVDIIAKPLGGIITAVAILLIGHQFNSNMSSQQMVDSRFRLYSELMSKREQAESDLRKDMFTSIINSFMEPETVSIESKVLNLELLTHNFHESLNMKPLFLHLKKKIQFDRNVPEEESIDCIKRLNRLAREVTRKQMVALETHGRWLDRTVTWKTGSGLEYDPIPEGSMTLDGVTREFHLNIREVNPETQEVEISLVIVSPGENDEIETASFSFSLGFFDFPMIDNIRLSNDHRCAVVLNNFAATYADITVVYFPGCYASLKERPYYQDVYERLLTGERTLTGGI